MLHEPPGPACMWAVKAPLGAGVGYAGPRIDFAPRDDAEWLLLCGDETALPAIAAILESAPRTGASSRSSRCPTPPRSSRSTCRPAGGCTGSTAKERRRRRRRTSPRRSARSPCPEGTGQAWGAAESRVARDLRAVLRDERGMPRTHASAKGYWLRSGDWLDEEE